MNSCGVFASAKTDLDFGVVRSTEHSAFRDVAGRAELYSVVTWYTGSVRT